MPEIARLGRTLKRWQQSFLAYVDTHRSDNGDTEAMNGLIELHRRVARGYRNRENYRLRMLLIGGGLTTPTPSRKSLPRSAPARRQVPTQSSRSSSRFVRAMMSASAASEAGLIAPMSRKPCTSPS